MLWKAIALGVVGYLFVGLVTIIVQAYISALMGRAWFSPQNRARWTDDNGGPIPPIAVLFTWPIYLPITAIIFIAIGVAKFVESLGDMVVEAGRNREKKLRGGRSA